MPLGQCSPFATPHLRTHLRLGLQFLLRPPEAENNDAPRQKRDRCPLQVGKRRTPQGSYQRSSTGTVTTRARPGQGSPSGPRDWKGASGDMARTVGKTPGPGAVPSPPGPKHLQVRGEPKQAMENHKEIAKLSSHSHGPSEASLLCRTTPTRGLCPTTRGRLHYSRHHEVCQSPDGPAPPR